MVQRGSIQRVSQRLRRGLSRKDFLRLSGAGVAGTVFMGAAGCGSDSGSGDGSDEGDSVVIALPEEPENLNPVFGDVYEGNWEVFNGLLRYERDLSSVPDLAAAMPEVSEDGRTITVGLREGVQFHDGEPMTADDVVFTYESILDPGVATGYRTLLNSLEEVRAVDERTVEFSLNRPDPAFMDKLQVGIIPEHILQDEDLNEAQFNREPVGTGPYRFEQWEAGERIVLSSNPDYYENRANIPRVVYTFIEDENARAAALEQGSVDIAGLAPSVAPRFEDAEGLELYEVPSADVRSVVLPTQSGALADPRVRRALSLAVDRGAMVEGVLRGYGHAAYGPVFDEHWAYEPRIEVSRDPSEAESMLEEAGWTETNEEGIRQSDGEALSFTLMYPAGDSVRRDAALAVSSQLEEIGVGVEVEGLGWEAIEPRIGEDAVVFGGGVPYDPDLELYNNYHSSLIDDGDPFSNPSELDDSTIDAALEQGRSTRDRSEREEAYSRFQTELAENGSWLSLVRLTHIVVASNEISGIEPQTQGHAHGFSRGVKWNIERWTLQGEGSA